MGETEEKEEREVRKSDLEGVPNVTVRENGTVVLTNVKQITLILCKAEAVYYNNKLLWVDFTNQDGKFCGTWYPNSGHVCII
jgi:hypothetical protein